MKIAIIGGGAAGFFAAINAKENFPKAQVTLFEKSNKVLSKVKISGGGRCNVTNGCTSIAQLSKAYPRGEKLLKKAFRVFNTQDTMNWYENRGVPLVIQEDNCVFPKSQDSQSIIDCLYNQTKRLNIEIKLSSNINKIVSINNRIELYFQNESNTRMIFDKVIVTTGGSPQKKGLNWLEELGHKIESPVPSLFTFNIPKNDITSLMGIVIDNPIVSIQGTKLNSSGPLLITHWGMSGPAVLKLSSFGAKILNKSNYNFNIQVNWVGVKNNEVVISQLNEIAKNNPNKLVANIKPFQLPVRLWLYLLNKKEIQKDKKWNELGKKGINRLVTILTNDVYNVRGKSVFREEFVTCGGISLESINQNTMQSEVVPNLYFAGEVLDIDGITGGYNFQAAWTTAFIAAKLK